MKLKRRKYIIDSRVQIRYALLFVVISLISNTLAVTAFDTLAMKQLDTLMWSTHININSTDELVRPIFIFINVINFVFVAVLLALTGFMMMKKTSGPLIRMSRDIRKVTDGDLSSRIVLRQKDDFKDVADELNRMTGELRERFSDIKEKYEGLSGSLHKIGKDAGKKEGPINDYDSLLRNIDEVETELNKLKL
ncbi:MAG: methyl-accepting chemotaxis protein [Nitrospirae bacterium]|nr:methyl-accepting chemotaxis protein [Nitrospirota bacterium]